MNLALSNFAWDYNESKDVFPLLREHGINRLELILTKYKPWAELSVGSITEYKKELELYQVSPYSMQSLFYSVNSNFQNIDSILNHFKRLINYSEILGIKILVLGSPNLRKRFDNYEKNLSIIFKKLDEILDGKDINVLIEPNMSGFGGEYFFSIQEIYDFIKTNKLNNIKTMIDTSNILLENGNPCYDLEKYFDIIYHIHVSEKNFVCLNDIEFHYKFADKIKNLKYEKVITFEVIKPENLNSCLSLFSKIYV